MACHPRWTTGSPLRSTLHLSHLRVMGSVQAGHLQVMGSVQAGHLRGEIEEPFQDLCTFTLYLTVQLRPSSGFLAYHWTSPTIILASYTGTSDELNAPDWVTLISNPCSFRQPRTHIVEVFMILAAQPENERSSQWILAWCFAVSSISHNLPEAPGRLPLLIWLLPNSVLSLVNALNVVALSMSCKKNGMPIWSDSSMGNTHGVLTPPQILLDLPATPTHNCLSPQLTAQPPGTLLSARRSAAIHAVEEHAAILISEALAEEPDHLYEPFIDDNWEEGEEPEADTNPGTNSPYNPQVSLPAAELFPSIPIATHVPAVKAAENNPDLFFCVQEDAHDQLCQKPSDVHPEGDVYLLYMLVTWLHLQFHVPVHACTVIIHVVGLIIRAFGHTINPPLITTLNHIMSKLDVEPVFDILPSSFMPRVPQDTTLCSPSSLSVQEFRITTSLEEELDAWGALPRTPGKMGDIFDGEVTKSLPAPDGSPFFRNQPGDEKGPNGELHIRVSKHEPMKSIERLLPYFDTVHMIIIDPMHNLLLGIDTHALRVPSVRLKFPTGLVKTHFYHIWVQAKILWKMKELHALHHILSEVMPAHLGCLPSLMGVPAELKKQKAAAKKKANTEKKKHHQEVVQHERNPRPNVTIPVSSPIQHATASLEPVDMPSRPPVDKPNKRKHQTDYCQELITLYGPDVMWPNHHYAMHTAECVRDFGPMHGFWTFLFEQLNKILKSYKTNNHSGGELEVTFFQEFHRMVHTSRMVSSDPFLHVACSARPGQPEIFCDAVDVMFTATTDDRSTLQALTHDLDRTCLDGTFQCGFPTFICGHTSLQPQHHQYHY
ncbi:uncharacterized protein LACBIDRAFT_324415 [Laccaria bicolor S238N-H82]|uniref:Predicted protein n=1 Tax=Laccaria bicolor (strain S238N-H82 / ATCC MYA-4686) TaxID=486041 RepID=B0D1R7_LACBS|nr:uncharacterized protein LACBIDRAFT_324415 [Laccaria bicolor S238N-H82]EDR12040.1 predicted protein [Laccaria bicolor S238N-H82]|eukprot:XP_001877937.1 predicted protein [Laccaria bicolor S238N-H82]